MSTKFGFLGLHVALAKAPAGGLCLNWPEDTEKLIKQYYVTDPNDWQCCGTLCVAPGSRDYDANGMMRSFKVFVAGDWKPLPQHASTNGFKGVTKDILLKLFDHLNVEYKKGQKPTLVKDLALALYKAVNKKASNEEAEKAYDKREADDVEQEGGTQIFEQNALDLVLEEMQNDDLEEAVRKAREKHTLKQAAKKLSSGTGTCPAPASAMAGSASSAGPATPLPVPWQEGRGLTQPEAKKLTPPGSSLSKDTKRHHRWQLTAPYMPISRSSSFIPDCRQIENEHLLIVLREGWKCREDAYGEKCPWNLDCQLFD